jgi:hypothetical protein
MTNKKKQPRPKPQQPQTLDFSSFIKFEDIRCMYRQLPLTPEFDFKVQNKVMEMLIFLNDFGMEKLSKDELWLYDVDNGELIAGIEPPKFKLHSDELRKSGSHIFMLSRRHDERFVTPISGLIIQIWNVDGLPPALDKGFQLILPNFNGIEFPGEFSLDRYSLLKLWKIG